MLKKVHFDSAENVQLYAHGVDEEDLYISTSDHFRLIANYRKQIAELKRELHKPKLIGLIGAAGSGKTTVGNIIERDYGFVKMRFAGPIKAMLGTMLACAGVSGSRLTDMIDGPLKETPCDELAGKTPRFALQRLGTEWGRDFISQNIWVDTTMAQVQQVQAENNKSVVIDDVRFPNEVRAIKDAGGRIFRVMRDHDPIPESGHKSEGQILEFDECVMNIGSVVELENQIAKLI